MWSPSTSGSLRMAEPIYFPRHFFSSHVYLLSIQQGVLETQEKHGRTEWFTGWRKQRWTEKRKCSPWIYSLLKNNNDDDQTFFSHSFVVCEEDQQQNQTWAQACSFSASLSFPSALPALPSPPAQHPPILHFIKPRIFGTCSYQNLAIVCPIFYGCCC